jgi:hypothetical protein
MRARSVPARLLEQFNEASERVSERKGQGKLLLGMSE